MIDRLPVDRSQISDEPIALGRVSEVFAGPDGSVIKLLRQGQTGRDARDEATRTAVARAAGAPAPEVRGLVDIDGRHGIVMTRVDADSLVDDVAVEPLRLASFARVFADLHQRILSATSDELPPVADVLARKIRSADIPVATRDAALDVVAAAPDGSAVLHGDYHPANVLMAPGGPIAIDWVDAARGPASADIAHTLLLLSTATIGADTGNRRMVTTLQGAFRRSYAKRIRRATRVSPKVLDAWRLPMTAARLADGIASEEAALRARLIRWTGT